jgi:hypothetical protein
MMSATTATTTTASGTTAAPAATASATAIATTVATVSASVSALAATVLAAITAASGRIVTRGVVAGSKILRRRSVGFRLTLIGVGNLGILMLLGSGRSGGFFAFAEFRGAILLLRGLIGRSVIGVRLIEMRVFVTAGSCEGFTGQQFDGGGHVSTGDGGERRVTGSMGVIMTMIVVFEVFEDIADIEKGVAIQADVDESRLHAWEDASNLTFVDAADERELFFPLDVDFD